MKREVLRPIKVFASSRNVKNITQVVLSVHHAVAVVAAAAAAVVVDLNFVMWWLVSELSESPKAGFEDLRNEK